VGHVVRMSEKRNAYKISVGVPERPHRRHGHRQKIFKWLFKNIRCECMEWIQLTQDKGHFLVLVNIHSFYVFVVRCFEFTQGSNFRDKIRIQDIPKGEGKLETVPRRLQSKSIIIRTYKAIFCLCMKLVLWHQVRNID
jgi:hypothetical protein